MKRPSAIRATKFTFLEKPQLRVLGSPPGFYEYRRGVALLGSDPEDRWAVVLLESRDMRSHERLNCFEHADTESLRHEAGRVVDNRRIYRGGMSETALIRSDCPARVFASSSWSVKAKSGSCLW
jgi:hypothetical protein